MDNAAELFRAICGQRRLGDRVGAQVPITKDMTETTQRTIVRSLTDLIEVVPILLGFHPHDSIVVLAVEDGAIRLTARADLTDDPSDGLAAVWRRLPRAQLIVLAATVDADRAWYALGQVNDAIPRAVDRILLHADGEFWFEHRSDEGTPYDAVGSIHLARAAYSGRPVRASRDDLYRLVEPHRSAAELTASIERVASRSQTMSEVVGEALALVEGHDEVVGELDIDDATILCLASHDPEFLDAVLLSTASENADARRSLWLQVVGGSVPQCAGGALVAVALAAWLTGDGALQSVCLEAMLDRPAPLDWVEVLDGLHRDAVPPQEWDHLRAHLLSKRMTDER